MLSTRSEVAKETCACFCTGGNADKLFNQLRYFLQIERVASFAFLDALKF